MAPLDLRITNRVGGWLLEYRDIARELTVICIQYAPLSDAEIGNHPQLVKSIGDTYHNITDILVNNHRSLQTPGFQTETAVAITKAIAARISLYGGRQNLEAKMTAIATRVTDIYFKVLTELEEPAS